MALFAISAMAMVIGSYMFVLLMAAACVCFPYFFLTNTESLNVQVLFLPARAVRCGGESDRAAFPEAGTYCGGVSATEQRAGNDNAEQEQVSKGLKS